MIVRIARQGPRPRTRAVVNLGNRVRVSLALENEVKSPSIGVRRLRKYGMPPAARMRLRGHHVPELEGPRLFAECAERVRVGRRPAPGSRVAVLEEEARSADLAGTKNGRES